MGEWSDYFEDYPEENQANYVGERFDPAGAARLRAEESRRVQVVIDSRAMQKKMFDMAAAARKEAAERAQQSQPQADQ